jgi:hypothetical protein
MVFRGKESNGDTSETKRQTENKMAAIIRRTPAYCLAVEIALNE